MIKSGVEEEETVDPRIEDKLEELNSWTERINNLEKEFDEANSIFRSFLTDYSDKLKVYSKKIGLKNIEEARSYYEARDRAAAAQRRCQKTVVAYEKACQMLVQAKGEIELTERRFQVNAETSSKTQDFDVLWQEMLNQATLKLQEAEQQKRKSKEAHEQSMKEFMASDEELSRLERRLRSVIKKTQPYFDESLKFKQHLLKIKEEIGQLSRKIVTSKSFYATTLKDLEGISEEIHQRRRLKNNIQSHSQSEDGNKEGQEDEAKGVTEAVDCNTRLGSPDYRDIVPELSLDSPRFHIEVRPRTLAVLSPQDLEESHPFGSTASTTTSSSLTNPDLDECSREEGSGNPSESNLNLDRLKLSGFDEVDLD